MTRLLAALLALLTSLAPHDAPMAEYPAWELGYFYDGGPVPVLDLVSPEFRERLTPAAVAILETVPVYYSNEMDPAGATIHGPLHIVLSPGCHNAICAQHEAIHCLQDAADWSPGNWYRIARLDPGFAYRMAQWLREAGYTEPAFGVEAQAYALQDYPNTPPPASLQSFAYRWLAVPIHKEATWTTAP